VSSDDVCRRRSGHCRDWENRLGLGENEEAQSGGGSGHMCAERVHAEPHTHAMNTHDTSAGTARTGLVAHRQSSEREWSDGVAKQTKTRARKNLCDV